MRFTARVAAVSSLCVVSLMCWLAYRHNTAIGQLTGKVQRRPRLNQDAHSLHGSRDSEDIVHDQLRIVGQQFYLGDKPMVIVSGAVHYFRTLDEDWRDRLEKLRVLGCNTVETYVPWNWHEPQPGVYDFTSRLHDLSAFIREAMNVGLYVIIRPSPFICSEWEWGGLPAWLLRDPSMKVRTMYPGFLKAVEAYYEVLMPILAPLQAKNGGPIIAFQVENEYGSFEGGDSEYIKWLAALMRKHGLVELFFTSDNEGGLVTGSVPDTLRTINLQEGARNLLAYLRSAQPDKPLMVAEFWTGWYDHWTEAHNTYDASRVTASLRELLSAGASVNLYMFHGGTNFGFMNGANDGPNHDQVYKPDITSYDYDALLTETGEITTKYLQVKALLSEFFPTPPLDQLPRNMKAVHLPPIKLTRAATLEDLDSHKLTSPVEANRVLDMENPEIGLSYGYLRYEFDCLPVPGVEQHLMLRDVRDRAQVFANGQAIGLVERWSLPASKGNGKTTFTFKVEDETCHVVILLENAGRVNYGVAPLIDRKGISEITLDGQPPSTLRVTPFAMDQAFIEQIIAILRHGGGMEVTEPLVGPTFYYGALNLDTVTGDTHIVTEDWGKGFIYVNGFNLGRFYDRGPQYSLYLPAALLESGQNSILVFDSDGASPSLELRFERKPVVG